MSYKIGGNIKKIRELRDITQDYMAKSLKVSQKTYSNIESNKTNVDTERLQEIANVLNVDPLTLLTFDERILLNVSNSEQSGVIYSINNSTSEREVALYDARINELKEQVSFLKEQIKELNKLLAKK